MRTFSSSALYSLLLHCCSRRYIAYERALKVLEEVCGLHKGFGLSFNVAVLGDSMGVSCDEEDGLVKWRCMSSCIG